MRAPILTLVLSSLAGLAACANDAPPSAEQVNAPHAHAVSTSTTVLNGSSRSTTYGQPITLVVTVYGSPPVPTGTVTVSDMSTSEVVCADVALDGTGSASCETSTVPAGYRSLFAQYNGDINFTPSTSAAWPLQVSQASTTVALVASPTTSVIGQPVVLSATVAAVAPGGGTPTGTVRFNVNGTFVTDCPEVPLSSAGRATCQTSVLPLGSDFLTADYSGSTDYIPSTGAFSPMQVGPATTALSLVANPTSSVAGQPIVLTATVAAIAPGGGSPDGSVSFTDNGNSTPDCPNAPLFRGTATCTLEYPYGSAAGSHTYKATFQAFDGDWLGSAATLLQAVQKASATVTLTTSPQPSVFGQPVTLSAKVAVTSPGLGVPTGTVTFRDAGASLGTVTLQADGSASLNTSSLIVGSHSLSVDYSGDSQTTAASTGQNVTQTVGHAAVAVALTSSLGASRFGEDVTFTVGVAAAGPGAGTPSGSVTVKDGGNVLAAVTLAGGTASFHSAALAVGTHTLTANYAGDASFLAGVGSLAQEIDRAGSGVTVTSSPAPSVYGQPVTFTATVQAVAPGAGVPTGTVTFGDGTTVLGTAPLGGSGAAVFSTSALAVGSHTVSATYAGDTSFEAASGSGSQVVGAGDVTVGLVAAPSPSSYGAPVTLTATVVAQSPAAGVPAGTITFRDGSTSLGTASLTSGAATLTVPLLAVGDHALTAAYGGSASFLAEQGNSSLQVNKGATQVTVTSSRQPSRAGRPVVFTATVTLANVTPTGTVTFQDGADELGAVSLTGGAASLTVRTLKKGTHVITAAYGGADSFAASTGTLTGGQVIENTPPVAGSGTALALGVGHASSAFGDASSRALDGVHTVELWARPGWTTPDAVGASPTMLRLGGSGSDRFALGVAPDRGSLALRLQGTETHLIAALYDLGWHHLALVEAGGEITAYVDGSAAGEVPGSLSNGQAAQVLAIGEGFTGELDEVRLWSSARTADQLAAEAFRPLAGTEDGLVGLWRMDEGEGAEAFDASPSQLDLAITQADGAVSFLASSAWTARATGEERALLPIAAGYDADGDPLTATITAEPVGGTATVDAGALEIGYVPMSRFLGEDHLSWTVSDGTDQSSYTVDITVSRILTCAQDSDCGGGDLCVAGACTAQGVATSSGGGGCSTGGGVAAWSLLVFALLQLSWRRRSSLCRVGAPAHPHRR